LIATANADSTLIQQQVCATHLCVCTCISARAIAQANAEGTKLIVNVQAEAYAQLKQELNFTNAQLFQYLWATLKLRASQPSDTLLVGYVIVRARARDVCVCGM
jgi:hypothetical protein